MKISYSIKTELFNAFNGLAIFAVRNLYIANQITCFVFYGYYL